MSCSKADIYDIIVIGSGIIGSCAAYHAAKSGAKTLKIDQFDHGHSNGSSHGKSRIIRYAHSDAAWIPIVKDTYDQIQSLEEKRSESLFLRSGLLWMGSEGYVKKLGKTIGVAGCEHEILDNKEINDRFPLFTYDEQWYGLFDPKGGVILADKWMNAFHDEFLKSGGSFLGDTKIVGYQEADGIIDVKTGNGEIIKCKKLIIAAGCWVNSLVPQLNIKSKNLALSVCYWKTKSEADKDKIQPDSMPVFIIDDQFDGGRGYFGIPTVDYPGAIKFGEHGGDVFESGTEPEKHDQLFVDRPRKHLEKFWPLMESTQPIKVDHCKYTMSPDGKYLIDYLGGSKNIVLCSMMSGTGFKCAPALGRCLVEMVMERSLPFDISIFRSARFENVFSTKE